MTIPVMTAGVTPANRGENDITWNILGQTYKPKQLSESSFAFDTLFPPGTFVPPHIHHDQDEFIFVHDGRFDLLIDGTPAVANSGDFIRLPRGIAHGIFNKGSAPVRALFWVAPAAGLYELFTRIHDVADPAEVVRLAALYNITFLPPPG